MNLSIRMKGTNWVALVFAIGKHTIKFSTRMKVANWVVIT